MQRSNTLNLVWDIGSLDWVRMQQPILNAGSVTAVITNDNTFAKETGGNLAAIKADVDKIPSQGQAAMANSLPVVIASNQAAFPVTANQGAGNWQENVAQFGGGAVATGVGASGAGIPRVTVSNDSVIKNTVNAPTTAALSSASISASSSGDNTIVAAVGGQTVRVHKIFLVAASVVTVTVKDGAGTSLTGAMTLGAMTLDLDSEPWFVTSVGNALILNLGSAVQVSGRVHYTQS